MAATSPMSALDFERWLCHAESGEQLVYHKGHLAADRLDPRPRGRRLNALADFVYRCSVMDTPVISDCYHIRGWETGAGWVELIQQRATGGTILYIAKRRD